MKNQKNGSTIILVVIVTTALSIGVFSVMGLVDSEFRKNKRAALHTEAKHAAEAIMQAANASLRNRLESSAYLPKDALAPTNTPLKIPSDFIDLNDPLSGSHLVLPEKVVYDSTDDFNSQSTELIGGIVPPGEWRFIDPRVPGNEFDELAGTRVWERGIELLSKATVERPNVGRVTAYARQLFQLREAPLFTYAVFYNLPMEISPGKPMELYGNVHSNHDTWLRSNNGLKFHGKFTTSGSLNYGFHPDRPLTTRMKTFFETKEAKSPLKMVPMPS